MDPPECTACGACCMSQQPHYIRVFAVDARRMDKSTRALHVVDDGVASLRFENGRCLALEVKDDNAERSARCTIYEQRPDACRWLVRGSHACLEHIAAKGLARG